MPALTAVRLAKMEISNIDPQTVHLTFSLIVDGEIVSAGSVLFTQPKYYAFENPNLRYEMQGDSVTIYAGAYAKAVQIEGVDGDLILEDNFFDMEKGERRVRILSGSATKLALKSVYDIR